MVTFFYYKDGHHNAGDCLMPSLAGFLDRTSELTTNADEQRKVVGIGSLLQHAVRPGDTVWGTGLLRPSWGVDLSNVDVLALRGPLTAKESGFKGTVPYGDPGMLMPLVYPGPPSPERRTLTAYLPHYVDYDIATKYTKGSPVLNVRNEWTQLVDYMATCQRIVTTSLHGVILAEAYKVPEVVWECSYSGEMVGGTFKFEDYFAGTGRPHQRPGLVRPMSANQRIEIIGTLLGTLRSKYPRR